MKYAIAVLLSMGLLSACSSDSDDSNDGMQEETPQPLAKFSLGLSDAPVDDADAVFIEIDAITLDAVAEGSEVPLVTIEEFVDESGATVDTVKVNLLAYQGSEQIKIVDETQNVELDTGSYSMEFLVVDSGSYVLLNNDATEHPIKVPSSRLRVGEFEVNNEAVQIAEQPAYTVEFDLRQSLVMRGNANNNNGFIVKPHGVRIVSLTGNIEGTLSADLTNLGTCTVYMYEGAPTELGDVFDTTDEDFVQPDQAITATAPLATTLVAEDGTYQIAFVPPGSYTLAITCGTEVDDNVQFDGLTIPMAADITPDAQAIEIQANQTTTVDFN